MVSRSGKFPPGPKGVFTDDDHIAVGNLHGSNLVVKVLKDKYPCPKK